MRVLCAPDKFKGTLDAAEAAAAMAAGAARGGPVADPVLTDRCPVADGGEGTLEALIAALEGGIRTVEAVGPLGEPVAARYGLSGDGGTGVVEFAAASGLVLVPDSKRDPTRTTSFGTGQLIAAAAEAGCRTVIAGIGGSATCDGAAGLAQALGARFYDASGRLIEEPLTGGRLAEIARFERPPPERLPAIRVACDVSNPLLGPNGAAAVYGPQKGATRKQVEQLDEALSHLAAIVGGDVQTAGYGASGGAGFGLAMMCGATLEPGIELILQAVGFEKRCRAADLVLTGEGRLDGQSLQGKACMGVASAADRLGVPA
ncbi:MAG: glycerate kinase, partial [Planctomycetota bacterium]|nr:glycerate kinase [Planctomycetota bacterium]